MSLKVRIVHGIFILSEHEEMGKWGEAIVTDLKCKMCGANPNIRPGQTLVTCDYCGSQMTLPRIFDDSKNAANLHNPASSKSMKRNYYEILGVDRNAGKKEINKAYRQNCLKNHPDINPGNPQAAEWYREATEAYFVLSDPERRRLYDMQG